MRYLWQRRLGSSVAALSLSFTLTACSGQNDLTLGQVMPGTGGAGGAAGNVGWIAPDAAFSDWSISQDGGPCAAQALAPNPADLALYVILDRSTDMQSQQNNGDWFNLLAAFSNYLQTKANPAIQWGLSYYPFQCSTRLTRACAPSGPQLVCDLANNSDPFWPLGTPASLASVIDPLGPDAVPMPGGQSVLRIAVDGAFGYLRTLKQSAAHANQLVVPVIIAGGVPESNPGCMPNGTTDVEDSLDQATPQTKAFVIAYDNNNNLDGIAHAGGAGTQSAFPVGTGQQTDGDLANAISMITQRSCAAVIPPGIDPRQINVQLLTPDGGFSDSEFVTPVRDHSQCSPLNRRQFQYYYDDPQSPKLIIGCDYTCQVLHGMSNSNLQILAGCPAVSIPGIR